MMRFNKTTEYAIRILAYMATNKDKSPHSATVIHKDLELPYKYITKLMTAISKKGLVNTARGRVGGFSLAKDSVDIKLIDIVSSVEHLSTEKKCVLGFPSCTDEDPCCLHEYWLTPNKAIRHMLETTTLQDLEQAKK